MNVEFEPGQLQNGHRYIICMHASATNHKYEYWKEDLEDLSTCSDGITVDTTAPIPGDVWIYRKDTHYQESCFYYVHKDKTTP